VFPTSQPAQAPLRLWMRPFSLGAL
jgi:hypothetical protein